jgi:hypothetical protein
LDEFEFEILDPTMTLCIGSYNEIPGLITSSSRRNRASIKISSWFRRMIIFEDCYQNQKEGQFGIDSPLTNDEQRAFHRRGDGSFKAQGEEKHFETTAM